MKFAPLTIILFCLAFYSTTAQKNFQPALVVNNAGDSIHGLVNIKDWEKNPESFLFKKDLNDPADKIFTINDVRYFQVGDFRYLRHLARITMDPIKAITATVSEVQPRTDTVFLRVLQTGKNISLFAYTDELKTRYYIMESGSDTPVELELRMKAWRDNYSVWHTGLFEGYKNQLTNLATKYGVITTKMQWDINHMQYGDDIVKVISTINGLDGKSTRARSKPAIHFYGGLSMNKSWLTYAVGRDTYREMANNAKSDPSINPGLTFGIDYVRVPNVSKLHLNFEMMITSMKNRMTSHQAYATSTVTLDYKIAFISFNPSVLLQYYIYQTKNTKLFIATGARVSTPLYYQNSCAVGGSNPTNTPDLFSLRRSWLSLPVKAGVLIANRAQIFGTYFTPVWFNNNGTTMKETFHTYQIGVNYFF